MKTTHYRDMPSQPTESEITFALSFKQTDEDRAGIAEWHAECAAVAAGVAREREIGMTSTRNERSIRKAA